MALRPLDLIIVAVYLAGITAFGIHFRRPQRTLRDYFLAEREIPWWAIALSIVAAETSTLTIISIPGLAYDTNLGFLQLVLGYLVGRVVITLVLLPQYFRGEIFTAYQLIERRFGKRLYGLTAGLFLVTRAAAEGVRVFAVSIVVGIALGSGDVASIALITLLTLVYTFEGGMRAVIWTDVVQMVIYVGGTIVGLVTLVHLVPGGWAAIQATAASAGKLHVFNFSTALNTPYTFWAGVIGGTFLTTASHGTDQLMVQRLLAARSQGQAGTALISSGLVILFQFTLFLLVGTALYVFYRMQPPAQAFASSDRIFPTFIVTQMPAGIAGLLIAAILAAAMSNLSAALNSLSATSIVDFYLRHKPEASESQRVWMSRAATIVWALALFALALLSRRGGRVVEVGLTIASVAYGGLLGVFLLGVLTRRATENGAITGMACGLALNLYLWLGAAHLESWLGFRIAWTWFVTLGTLVTFAVGYLVSLASKEAEGDAAANA
jgi:SSS family transporter